MAGLTLNRLPFSRVDLLSLLVNRSLFCDIFFAFQWYYELDIQSTRAIYFLKMERNFVKERICDINEHNLVTSSSMEQTSAEFVSAVENETDKCKHFSIRAYVAEQRRKDWKISWPFSSFGDNEEPKEQADMLPPLHVPEFRWWGCQNCLQRSASDDAADYRVVSNTSEEKICDGGKANVNTSLDMIGYECRPMIYHYMTEKGAGVMSSVREDVFTSGKLKNSLVRKVNQTEPTPCERKDAQSLNEERVTKDAEMINLNLQGGKLIELGKPNCGISDGDKVGYGVRSLNCASNNSTEICQKGKLVSRVSKVAKMRKQQKEVMMYQQRPQVVMVENEVLDSLISHTCKLRSLEFKENQEIKGVENIHDKHNADQKADSGGTLNCRKPQKVRLLTDIIRREIWGASTMISSSNEITNSGSINTEVTQTIDTDESDSLGFDTFLGSQVAVPRRC
ncbi:hypothetical protein F0562_024684 [Nyssa sinensis]|uniref:Uncharacterized protein n=1 Tax=Nyssa sinensis TaxID=561372 RepID=A0A5J5BFC0_9ASTE|nr:hypothetical protein F0562_024684 [Nyssa sinensis]